MSLLELLFVNTVAWKWISIFGLVFIYLFAIFITYYLLSTMIKTPLKKMTDEINIMSSGNLNVNFGTITGVSNNDIVEYTGSVFEVVYDVSVAGEGALTWNMDANYYERWNGVVWSEFGGLSGVTAGAGLTKTGNTIDVGAGDGVTVNANDVAVTGNCINGAQLADTITLDDDLIFTQGSYDVDFESRTLVIDGSSNMVGIGGLPTQKLYVNNQQK